MGLQWICCCCYSCTWNKVPTFNRKEITSTKNCWTFLPLDSQEIIWNPSADCIFKTIQGLPLICMLIWLCKCNSIQQLHTKFDHIKWDLGEGGVYANLTLLRVERLFWKDHRFEKSIQNSVEKEKKEAMLKKMWRVVKYWQQKIVEIQSKKE